MTRQPSLFNFKPVETLRNSGLTPQEERDLIIAASTGKFPRRHTVKRTGTKFIFRTPEGAERLLKNLHFGNRDSRKELAS